MHFMQPFSIQQFFLSFVKMERKDLLIFNTIRKAKGISQEQLAWDSGFELSQIGRIERGEVNTSISHVSAIAKSLKVKPEELFQF